MRHSSKENFNTARYSFMLMVFLGILSTMKDLKYLIAYSILENYPMDILFTTVVMLYLTVTMTIIMYLLIGKSALFFKTWLYSYGVYILLDFINSLVIYTNLENTITSLGARLLFYIFWTIVMIFSKSFDEEIYGIQISDKLAKKVKNFSVNIWR